MEKSASLHRTVDSPSSRETYGDAEYVSADVSEGEVEWQKAKALHEADRFSAAAAVLKKCAPSNANCQNLLGRYALTGQGGYPQNLTMALAHWTDAADNGHADAQFSLALFYSNFFTHQYTSSTDSESYERDEAQAVLHLYAASFATHPGALMALGYRHLHGYGVPRVCLTSALNYIEVAKRITQVYSMGLPQALELVRLGVHNPKSPHSRAKQGELAILIQLAEKGDLSMQAAVGKRYLLGIDGFKQDYAEARKFLRMAAANANYPPEPKTRSNALALLGYVYAMGLGVETDLSKAEVLFEQAVAEYNEPIAHNGLGYISFHGTPQRKRDLGLAFQHFNESAHGHSADGQFNLAALYMTGTGVTQSFQRALMWYARALEKGHTPAAYSLAVMYLNGLGTVRDCSMAVTLLKKVCERGEWVTKALQDAYRFEKDEPNLAAFQYWKLAEAGHEVAQSNLAHLIDSGAANLFFASDKSERKIHAQRFYEMSAEQGSAASDLKLGDYAYGGWGLEASYMPRSGRLEAGSDSESANRTTSVSVEDSYWWVEPAVRYAPRRPNYQTAVAFYRKAAETVPTNQWMMSHIARASHDLGFMYQYGMGVQQDLHLAKRHYERVLEIDPTGPRTPVQLSLLLLAAYGMYVETDWKQLVRTYLRDYRMLALLWHLALITLLIPIRFIVWLLQRRQRRLHRLVNPRALVGTDMDVTTLRQLHQRNPAIIPIPPGPGPAPAPVASSSSARTPAPAIPQTHTETQQPMAGDRTNEAVSPSDGAGSGGGEGASMSTASDESSQRERERESGVQEKVQPDPPPWDKINGGGVAVQNGGA
ncbi:unnamed protein product [Vitrella brassicaformis CCMP3155]|uniref:Uncharacterized protein n=1 Tax=Vitrella brassicaformis (strain CCMP3155) TaxID=1169540 RepID=A0A0G4EDX7_VITBC|nr:unnamed protein product [Vitrella brassicaformis CCMP3155]|eukprot:CEL93954.1 unnamed protein product [Vitrella brassicaformis CCMP3155]